MRNDLRNSINARARGRRFLAPALALSMSAAVAASAAVPRMRVGVAEFRDSGAVPTPIVNPKSLRENLAFILASDHGLSGFELEPPSPTDRLLPDPDTMLPPLAYRDPRWRGPRSEIGEEEWSEAALESGVAAWVGGRYERAGDGLRYLATVRDAVSGRVLGSCHVEGATSERFRLESDLAAEIAGLIDPDRTEADGVSTSEPVVRRSTAESDSLPRPATGPTAEDHYKNGYTLTRRYMSTQDRKFLAGAAEEYRAAVALDPDHYRAINNLGTVMHRLGEYEAALGYFDRVLEIAPEYAPAMENAALTYRALGRTEEAVKMWREALEYETREEIRADIEATLGRIEGP